MKKEIKIFIVLITVLFQFILLLSLISKIPDSNPPDQKESLVRLIIDSIKSHHIINRQNEMIIHFKKYGNLYVKEENNCFTRK